MKPPLRMKCVSTKVSEKEFVALENRALGQKLTLSSGCVRSGRPLVSKPVAAQRYRAERLMSSCQPVR